MKIKLAPDKKVRCTPNPGEPYGSCFPAFTAVTNSTGNGLLVAPGITFGWSPSWSGYRGAEAHDDEEDLPLYSRYDFEDDGTYICWACVPCHIVYHGSWQYEE